MGRDFLIKPGSVFLILVICGTLYGMFVWAESSFMESGRESIDKQDEVIGCSNLNVRFVDKNSNETHQTVFVQVSRDLEALSVTFHGEQNRTKVIEDIDSNSVRSVSAKLDQANKVEAKAKGCDKVFG